MQTYIAILKNVSTPLMGERNIMNTSTTPTIQVYRLKFSPFLYSEKILQFCSNEDFSAAYVVLYDNQLFKTGYHTCTISNSILLIGDSFNFDSYKTWERIPFRAIHPYCQKDLLEQMGELFPWGLSYWETREAFNEYWDPQTLEGIIEKSLRDSKYFYYKVVTGEKKELFFSAISDSLCIKLQNYPAKYVEKLITINDKVYLYCEGYQIGNGYFARLSKSSKDDLEFLRNELKEEKAITPEACKEHARKCSAIASKYGLKFEIALRCFKGNEEDIKLFVESLNNAFGKEYNASELLCGRMRRHAEINRLGIEIGNVDPNHIAPYILACLDAGKIVK